MKHPRFLILLLMMWFISNCSSDENPKPEMTDKQANSPYVLPYPVGQTYQCWQGRFTGGHNRWNLHYAQDFEMELGTVITAARAGVVYLLDESVPENTGDDNIVNFILIRHSDGNYSRYVHLGENKVYVKINQQVSQGDTIALTGNTGNTGGVPHLHFDVIESPNGLQSQTIPVWFKNTKAHPSGVETGEYYTAEPY